MHDGIEREQQRCGIADRRRGGEISSERGAIADERRREERQPLSKHIGRVAPSSADLVERQRGANPDRTRRIRKLPELRNAVHADKMRPAAREQV